MKDGLFLSRPSVAYALFSLRTQRLPFEFAQGRRAGLYSSAPPALLVKPCNAFAGSFLFLGLGHRGNMHLRDRRFERSHELKRPRRGNGFAAMLFVRGRGKR